MNILYIAIPTVTTISAWATSRLMMWGIFHPVAPVKIAGLSIQGILPHLQQHPKSITTPLAHAINNTILQQSHTANLDTVRPLIEQHLDTYLTVRLKEKMPVIASFIGPATTVKLKESMIEEIDTLLPQVINSYVLTEYNHKKIEEKLIAAINNTHANNLQKNAAQHFLKSKLLTVAPLVLGMLLGFITDILCYVLTL